MTWIISKEFSFEYAHRVWSQKLDKELSCNVGCKCQVPHGHGGRLLVHLTADKLDEQQMVTDFHNLNWLKEEIDNHLDHKTLLDINDPALGAYLPLRENYEKFGTEFTNAENFITVKTKSFEYKLFNTQFETDPEFIKVYSGYVLVNFVPTSENICKWFYDIVSRRMELIGVKVSHIEFFETPKSNSKYYG